MASSVGYGNTFIIAIIYRNIYKNIGKLTGVSNFERSASWIFWGRILGIVLVGFVVDLVGRIMLTVSFFHLPDTLPGWEEPTKVANE
ncbi:MAG TPA: DUF996 domain-containing protein [Coprothermobacter sp.]|nr:DUF996 domain-containing protein [Coprothermobacter sp.]